MSKSGIFIFAVAVTGVIAFIATRDQVSTVSSVAEMKTDPSPVEAPVSKAPVETAPVSSTVGLRSNLHQKGVHGILRRSDNPGVRIAPEIEAFLTISTEQAVMRPDETIAESAERRRRLLEQPDETGAALAYFLKNSANDGDLSDERKMAFRLAGILPAKERPELREQIVNQYLAERKAPNDGGAEADLIDLSAAIEAFRSSTSAPPAEAASQFIAATGRGDQARFVHALFERLASGKPNPDMPASLVQ